MLVIAHRGNVSGPGSCENRPDGVRNVIDKTPFDVEVDVWWQDRFWFGHDAPSFAATECLLTHSKVWCHAKNLEALSRLLDLGSPHVFFHDHDAFTLTSCGKIWTYPNEPTCEKSIIVALDLNCATNCPLYGICTDYPFAYDNEILHQE